MVNFLAQIGSVIMALLFVVIVVFCSVLFGCASIIKWNDSVLSYALILCVTFAVLKVLILLPIYLQLLYAKMNVAVNFKTVDGSTDALSRKRVNFGAVLRD